MPRSVSPPDRMTQQRPAGPDAPGGGLRHLLIAGGSRREWAEMSSSAWNARIDAFGGLCAELGIPWLTMCIAAPDRAAADAAMTDGGDSPLAVDGTHRVVRPSSLERDGDGEDSTAVCAVTVDSRADGRQRFVDAVNAVPPGTAVDETAIATSLYGQASAEPDLVVVLGPPEQLPSSLVWELAYAELVYLATPWSQLSADDLAGAITDFARRRRRFGGLDAD